LGIRLSLHPLIPRGLNVQDKLARMRGEIAKLWLHTAGCLKT
jgi:hypothetical protein